MHIPSPMIPIFLLFFVAACGNKEKTPDAVAQIESSGAVPESVRHLVRAVADADSTTFASLVSYPLQRPYPLKDIADAKEMSAYYHKLVDDSLRNILITSGPGEWDRYGWRGWSVKNCEYLWVDSLLYDMPYISAAEKAEIGILSRREIESLPPALRGDWQPVTAFRISNGKTARIDRLTGTDPAVHRSLRLAIWPANASLKADPECIMPGSLEYEGSAMSPVYSFSDPAGNKATFFDDPFDVESPRLLIDNPAGESSEFDTDRIYWLDSIR